MMTFLRRLDTRRSGASNALNSFTAEVYDCYIVLAYIRQWRTIIPNGELPNGGAKGGVSIEV